MALAHVSLGKIAYVAIHVVALAFFALDPSERVAYIGLAGVALTNLTALVIFYLKLRRVDKNVDGIMSRAENKNADQAVQLGAATTRADRAEGHLEGSNEERARDKP